MAKSLLAFLCIVMTVGLVKSRVEKFWAPKQVVRPGENIVLTCEFSDLDPHDPVRFSKHYPDNKTFPLTDNYVLVESLQEDSQRFNFSYKEFGGGVATQTLTIMNAVPGDSGNYSCFMRDIDKNKMAYYVFLEIAVEDEPDTIKLYLGDIELINGSNSVPLKFLQAQKLRCETTRSNPGANITITAGNGMHVRLTNTTVGNATYDFDNKDLKYDFVVPVYRTTTALVDKWVFDMEAYGRPVVCSAKVNRDAPGIVTSFNPFVADGPPQIECNETVYARDGQRSFVINCLSYAKPSLTKAMFYFAKVNMNYTIPGFPFNVLHSSTDGKFRGIVETNDDIKSTMRLTIDMVELKAGIVFNFYVANNYGQDIHQVTIKDPSMAVSSSNALSTCLVTFLFIWLMGFGIRIQL